MLGWTCTEKGRVCPRRLEINRNNTMNPSSHLCNSWFFLEVFFFPKCNAYLPCGLRRHGVQLALRLICQASPIPAKCQKGPPSGSICTEFCPQIDAGGRVHDLGDVRAAAGSVLEWRRSWSQGRSRRNGLLSPAWGGGSDRPAGSG